MDQRILSVISKQIAELFHLSSIPKLAADDPRKRGKRIEKKKVNYTSYIDLLTSVRQALAVDYLSTTLLTVDDIAAALGFSDATSFRHAFKRWTGRTLTEYRAGAGQAVATPSTR